MNRKISNSENKIQGVKARSLSLSHAHELDQIWKSFHWRVHGSHDSWALAVAIARLVMQFPYTVVIQTNQPKNAHNRDMFWKTFSCWRKLIRDASIPLKFWFFELLTRGVLIDFIFVLTFTFIKTRCLYVFLRFSVDITWYVNAY